MVRRKIIEIDENKCTGCGECVVACAEGALAVIDGKARVLNEVFCDGLGACIGECPEEALQIVEKEAPGFDDEAVKKHLASIEHAPAEIVAEAHPCACPSAVPTLLKDVEQSTTVSAENDAIPGKSELVNWPVQWRLVQPSSPFFKDAHILLAADCCPFTYPNFHKDFLKNRPTVIGCPKLDEQEAFLKRLVDLFSEAKPKSVKVVMMEVPCCSALLTLTKKALELAGSDAPVESVVIGIDGRLK
ncbi:MAG: 4Fe-4S binding protein [Methanobacteriota archaeon]|nr:MAG: 4Fe-4S binding protein [Euryarchaeota archaeon]